MREILLVNIKTDIEWQLACEASKHAELNKRLKLVYEVFGGDITIIVQSNAQQTTIRRVQ